MRFDVLCILDLKLILKPLSGLNENGGAVRSDKLDWESFSSLFDGLYFSPIYRT